MVAPQSTIKVTFGGEKPFQLPDWTKNSRTTRTMGTEVPRSYPLVHRGGLICPWYVWGSFWRSGVTMSGSNVDFLMSNAAR